MYISSMRLINFRSFDGEHYLKFSKGINIFVGENNSGKTTIFKAIEFIQSGKNKEDWISKNANSDHVSVEIEFSGENIEQVMELESLRKYQNFISDKGTLKIMRSSEPGEWVDSKNKIKKLELKNIRCLNPETNQYENPSGIDSTISALFDAQFVYSDLKNEDYQDFGKTKIVGKLINAITQDFQKDTAWQKFRQAHKTAFGEEGIVSVLQGVQNKIEGILTDQYGKTKVEFDFGLPELENFFKTGTILLEENGVKTVASDKGTGMQRALALSLIQVYSELETNEDNSTSKPLLFFIDEPETFLHPQAQNKLLKALERISTDSQVFITTHSPYLLRSFNKDKHTLKIFSRNNPMQRIKDDIELNLLPHSPSWGEINYFAFNIPSPEFHNELFATMHTNLIDTPFSSNQQRKVTQSLKSLDSWLDEECQEVPKTDETHVNAKNPNDLENKDLTMPVYIRNYINHPGEIKDDQENNIRLEPTPEELNESIEFMLTLLERRDF